MPKLSPRVRKTLNALVAAYVLYVLLGFTLVPWVIKKVTEENVAEALGRSIAVEDVSFNPFTLSTTFNELVVEDDWQRPLFRAGRLVANLQITSVFLQTVSVDLFELDDAELRLEINEQGTLNIQELLELLGAPAEPEPEEPADPMGFHIDRIVLQRVSASFLDQSVAKPFQETIGPMSFEVINLATSPDATSPYSFEAKIGEQTDISWEGRASLVPLASEGKLAVQGLRIAKGVSYWSQYADVLAEASINIEVPYRFSLQGAEPVLTATNALLEVNEFDLSAEDIERLGFGFTQLSLRADAYLADRSIVVHSLNFRDPAVHVVRAADGSLALPHLPFLEEDPEGEEEVESETGPGEADQPWKITATGVRIENASLTFHDNALPGAPSFGVGQVNLSSDELYYGHGGQKSKFQLTGAINQGGSFRGEFEANLDGPSASGTLGLEGLSLPPWQPYVANYSNANLRNGKVDTQIRFAYSASGAISVNGQTTLSALDVGLLDASNSLLQLESLAIDGYSFADGQFEVERIAIVKPAIDLLIDGQGAQVARIAKTAEPRSEEDAASASEEPAETSGGDLAAESDEPTELPIGVLAQLVEVIDGSIQVRDQSVDPQFKSSMTQFQFRAESLSSEPESLSPFRFSGQFDGAATLEVDGSLMPLEVFRDTRFQAKINSYDLTATSPYWSKYLGRTLAKGSLNLNTTYQIENSQLKVSKDIMLDQLTLGEQTDSPDALKLPIGFAIAVLKNKQGIIDYDNLEISGDLSDPTVNKGTIIVQTIGKVIGNIVTKAITSPFAVLSGIAGGKENLDTTFFAAGAVQLGTQNISNLDGIAKILEERPGLRIDILSFADAASERQVLQRAALAYALRQSNGQDASLASADPIDLLESYDEERFELLVEERFRQYRAAQAAAEQAEAESDGESAEEAGEPTAAAADGEEEKRGFNPLRAVGKFVGLIPRQKKETETEAESAGTDQGAGAQEPAEGEEPEPPPLPPFPEMLAQVEQLYPDLDVPEDWTRLIARERANRARSYLVDTKGIAAERVFLAKDAEAAEAKTEGSYLKFELKD